LSDAKSFLKRTHENREAQNTLFLQRKSEHETAIEAVALARTKTSQLYGAYESTNDQTTLIQAKSGRAQILVEVQNHLEAAAKIPKFGAIIKLLQ
jgi:late competence protein required for DNA uptake (superfamily II DNA/RNA helicase)